MHLSKYLFLAGVGLFAFGCKTSTKTPVVETEIRMVDTLVVTAPKKEPKAEAPKPALYNPSYTRRNDLIHTKLDVRFNWEKQHLYGKAWLELKPLFYPTDSLRLDAKGFDVAKVAIMNAGVETPLKYTYNNRELNIKLDRFYTSKEKYTIYIEYTAKPNELPLGGSNAITQDKGLYFINPKGEEPNKPRQIWTQGETESSSCWFPTVDKPNERCTQEIFITIENNFKTLSNGVKQSSTVNADGTRTDYWIMNQPHAPYLFMMAIGEFAVVTDTWNGKLLEYYVEPKYEQHAKQIFNHTGEMLSFFSEKMGVDYPWPKYSQVIVRDYVSGAMENTTAVIFGDFVQKTARELEDSNNDGIVAHEMFHHWFGDYVTCESWANLPLNESFANYSEYLWYEHKYGKDFAEKHRLDEANGYFTEAKNSIHNLIYFDYESREDPFDRHSYNKGGTILHMLRTYVGDEAFFASLKYYLNKHAYTEVEAHELRLAFEDVTGEDLNWFFNQWFYGKGHPVLNIDYAWDEAKKVTNVTITQMQDFSKVPLFTIPMYVDVYADGKTTRQRIWVKQASETFSFASNSKPNLVNVDAQKTLLCEKKDNKAPIELAYQYYNAPEFVDRLEALSGLKTFQREAPYRAVYEAALNDKSEALRGYAVKYIKADKSEEAIADKIAAIALNDTKAPVRAEAYYKLADMNAEKYYANAEKTIANDRSYAAIAAALDYIKTVNKEAALKYAASLNETESSDIALAVADIYAESGDLKYSNFYESAIGRFSGYPQMLIMNAYVSLLQKSNSEQGMVEGAAKLRKLALDMSVSQFGRYAATNGIRTLKGTFLEKAKDATEAGIKERFELQAANMQALIEEIKAQETDKMLKQYYKGW
jgi:aminopeptidase N